MIEDYTPSPSAVPALFHLSYARRAAEGTARPDVEYTPCTEQVRGRRAATDAPLVPAAFLRCWAICRQAPRNVRAAVTGGRTGDHASANHVLRT